MRFYYYTGMILAMVAGLVTAMVLELNSADDSVYNYAFKSSGVRASEYEALMTSVREPTTTAEQYFNILLRLEELRGACMRADRQEKGESAMKARWMELQLGSLQNELVAKLPDSIARSEAFRRMSNDAWKSNPMSKVEIHQDPWATFAWFLFFVGSMPFVVIHYAIRLTDMNCRVWPEIFSNWKFPFWVLFWPVGIFKYPRAIDPREQIRIAWRRMHRIATLILSSALTFCGAIQTASAQKDDPAGQQSHTLHVNVTTLTLPEYLGMDGAIFHPAPVQQTSVTVSWSGGLYASLWNSMPLGNLRASPNFGRELDYSVGWTGKVSKVTVSLDATCIDVTPLGTIRGNVFQPSITLSHGFALARKNTVEPFLWVRGAMPVLGETPHRGLFLHEGLRHVWTGNGNLSASSSAELIHDSGAFGFNRAYLGRATFGGSYRLKNHWQLLFPIVRWSVPLTHVTDGRRSEFVLGGGLAYSR